MNFTKLMVLACPAILASLLMTANSAQAEIAVNPTLTAANYERTDTGHFAPAWLSQLTSDPQFPRGCGCLRCTQSVDPLQGKLPKI